MELAALGIFAALLLVCVALGQSVLWALGAGFVLFFGYGLRRGFGAKELLNAALSGIKTVKNILISFVLIGMLTALWRAAGTIPVIVSWAAAAIQPGIFLLMVFVLNALVSVLTGTAFGTAATMGVICSTMAAGMGFSSLLVGGAVLAGVYFGDRCSPVSTSALLVAELTGTSVLKNIRNMLRTAAVPTLLSCGVFLLLGMGGGSGGEVPDLAALFARAFRLHWAAALPAAAILVLSACKVSTRNTLGASVLIALCLSVALQGVPLTELPGLLLRGYQSADPEIAAMMNGGGIFSMVKVGMIVMISSTYSGIFKKTGLLNGLQARIGQLAGRVGAYGATLITAALASMIACNQTLAILLTQQLCGKLRTDASQSAIDLEDSAVVAAPLVPWSIAGAVPLTAVGAPTASILMACYLYLLPLWRLITSKRKTTIKTKENHAE